MSRPPVLKAEHFEQLVKPALADPNVPRIYCNSFAMTLSSGDIMLVGAANGKPAALINMSYTVAKSLSEKLAGLIESFESASEHEIMTTETTAAAIDKLTEQNQDAKPE